MAQPKPKYEIGEHVIVSGWTSSDSGEILAMDWIYHSRNEKYVWGYHIKWDNDGAGFSFIYIPEGYLKKFLAVTEMTNEEMISELFGRRAAIGGKWIPNKTTLREFLTTVREGSFNPKTVTDEDRSQYMSRFVHTA